MIEKPVALIVEDNEDLAFVFETAMREAGYEVITYTDGEKALNYLLENVPDVVVLDLHLPKISGDLLFRHIRTNARLAKTKIFLTTADSRLAEELRPDADLVFLKPISYVQLKELASRYKNQSYGE